MASECYCHIRSNQPFKLQGIKTVLIFNITNSLCILTDNPKTFPRPFSESLMQEVDVLMRKPCLETMARAPLSCTKMSQTLV